jgi:thioredoxin reductase
LHAVTLEGGHQAPRDAVFVHLGRRPRSPLAEMLGCEVEEDGVVVTWDKQRTPVPGLYLTGDASHDVKFAIVAAAHGARAAHDINQALREEDTA